MGDVADDILAHIYDPWCDDDYDEENDIHYTIGELGRRIESELDRLGVRMPDKPKQPKRGVLASTVDPWWERGEDPPF